MFSPFTGRVTQILAKLGDRVQKGQPLMKVEASEFVQAQSDLITAKAQYNLAVTNEQRQHELYQAEDAEVLLVGYGIVSRVLRTVVDHARAQGFRAGLFRPITLWPYPAKALREAAARVRHVLVVEMSTGQMVEDVRLTLDGRVPVDFYGRSGGNVPGPDEIRDRLLARAADLVAVGQEEACRNIK